MQQYIKIVLDFKSYFYNSHTISIQKDPVIKMTPADFFPLK